MLKETIPDGERRGGREGAFQGKEVGLVIVLVKASSSKGMTYRP